MVNNYFNPFLKCVKLILSHYSLFVWILFRAFSLTGLPHGASDWALGGLWKTKEFTIYSIIDTLYYITSDMPTVH